MLVVEVIYGCHSAMTKKLPKTGELLHSPWTESISMGVTRDIAVLLKRALRGPTATHFHRSV